MHPENWIPVGVDSLEANADEVVRSNIHYSVIAGPGAGKTELLAQRACYLLQTNQCPYPKRVLAISFKKDAAKNLKDRVAQRCCSEDALRFDSFTFAAFAKSILDRFVKAIPQQWQPMGNYEIYDSNQATEAIPDFILALAHRKDNKNIRESLLNIYKKVKIFEHKKSFEKEHVLSFCLPLEREELSFIFNHRTQYPGYYAALEWWNTCLKVGEKSLITFPMIERLAELILRINPLICNALRTTYSHVFMDEFQDTTNIQYDLIKTAFLSSKTFLTAVGDNKQQIMRFAMALDDAFGDFEKDFDAKRIQLAHNYRSSASLVEIQHHLARTIDQNSQKAVAQKALSIQDESCIILEFDTRAREAEYLAEYISRNIQSSNLTPRDFALLVKQKADDHARLFAPIFQKFPYSLKLRVEAELQDILAENLTLILITFLRFGSKDQAGVHWIDCLNIVKQLRGLDSEDHKMMRSIQTELNEFHSMLREHMKTVAKHKTRIISILRTILDFIGQENIERNYAEYKQRGRCEEIVEKISTHLAQSCSTIDSVDDWNAALDSFEGKDSIPILTIHKSKGLEYHTVIFVGFDDKEWWSFERQPAESRSTFFVAFSRAKQRIIFTYCKQRGEKKKIASLYKVLSDAGVKTTYIS
jgi:superfamily I DNA/RNA helicase